ncbi:MAG: riboflavin synthase [Pseudomonadota bacterium]
MFTGLVEEIGAVSAVEKRDKGYDLTIRAKKVLDGTMLGDSISVNGVCLTVTDLAGETFRVGLAPETRAKTNLEDLSPGAAVNLERSVTPSTRLGGHYVQGHVDATGQVKSLTPDEDALWVAISAPQELMRYIVPKGYIAIDGTSLTVVETGADWFNVTLIAYTQNHIVLPRRKVGDRINLEVDILGKYVEKLLAGKTSPAGGLTRATLAENGFT